MAICTSVKFETFSSMARIENHMHEKFENFTGNVHLKKNELSRIFDEICNFKSLSLLTLRTVCNCHARGNRLPFKRDYLKS